MTLSLFQLHAGDLFALATAVSWAFAIIFFRLATFSHDSVPLKIFQNTLAVALFIAAAVILKQPLFPSLTLEEWLFLTLSAILGITVGDTVHISALRRIGAANLALVDCLYSPFVIFFAYVFFAEVLTPIELIGAALIIAAVITGTGRGARPRDMTVGLIYAIAAQLCMALCVMVVRHLLYKHSVLTLTGYRFAIGNVLLVLYAYLKGEKRLWSSFRFDSSMKWMVLGTVFGPFLATLFWFSGFKYTLAGRAAIFNQLSSIFIFLLAMIFLKEKLNAAKWLAVFIAVGGALLVAL